MKNERTLDLGVFFYFFVATSGNYSDLLIQKQLKLTKNISKIVILTGLAFNFFCQIVLANIVNISSVESS